MTDLTPEYLEQMRAHVDSDGTLSHINGVELLSEVERLRARLAKLTSPVSDVEAAAHLSSVWEACGICPDEAMARAALEAFLKGRIEG